MAKGGYRPNAGRHSVVDEALRARVIEKSWKIIDDFYDNESETKEDKRKVATYLAGKSVPQNVNLGGQPGNPIEQRAILTWMK